MAIVDDSPVPTTLDASMDTINDGILPLISKNNDALDYYEKAAHVNSKDEFTSSEFLFKAALFAESIGKKKEAIDLYKKIKTDYPTSEKATNVDRYLARLGEVNE